MNRLVIIGNGFDIAHGLKTSYMDFINWYWEQRVDGFMGNIRKISEDCLCKLSIKENPNLTQFDTLKLFSTNFSGARMSKCLFLNVGILQTSIVVHRGFAEKLYLCTRYALHVSTKIQSEN